MTQPIYIGIGNPPETYAHTFHNAGISFIHQTVGKDASWQKRTHVAFTKKEEAIYAYTLDYMNTAGIGVRELRDWLKADIDQIVIVHDDTDQALGTAKLVYGGGSGGHNGIRSVEAALGTNAFWRLKIGVRPERFSGTPHIKARSFVLDQLTEEDTELLYNAGFAAAAKSVLKLMENSNPSGPERISAMGNVTAEKMGSASSDRLNESS